MRLWRVILLSLLPALAWAQSTGINGGGPNGSGGTPGGTNGQIQYNNNGVFGGYTTIPLANILTCATTQIVFDSAGSLVCSANFTWDNTNARFLMGGTGVAELEFNNSTGTSGARRAAFGLYDQGGFALIKIAPATDAGAVSATDFFTVISGPTVSTPQLQGLQYSDTFACAGTGENWSLASGDMQVQAANCAPAITVQDTGTSAAAAAVIAAFSTAGNGALVCAPNNNQFSGGVATNACYLGTGTFNGGTGNIPLVFGTNHVYAGRVSNTSQGLLWGAPTGGDEGAGSINAAGGVFDNGVRIKTVLTGTTGNIGGGALAAGACTSGTVAVANSTTAMPVDVSPAAQPQADASHGLSIWAFVSSAGTVTVNVCAIIATTPNAVAYNVRVIQ